MLYVLGSDEAKAANMNRFDIFFGIANDHAGELSSLVGRLANGIASENLEAILKIERDCSWVLRQIKYKYDVSFDIARCFSQMQRISDDAYGLFIKIIPNELASVQKEVDFAFRNYKISSQHGSIENMKIRLRVQSEILDNRLSKDKIRTIAHDSAMEFAIYYFVIDRNCLFYRR